MVQDILRTFPKPYKGIQVNYCVSTGCKNFGISNAELYQPVENTKSLNIYYCPQCGAYPQIIDNQAVYETIEHQKRYHELTLTSCPNTSCKCHSLAVHAFPDNYRSYGKTNSQKQRYQCRDCQTVFTDQLCFSNANAEVQNAIFYGMMYSFGVRNICQKLAITPKSFYKHQRTMVNRLQYIAHVKETAFYQTQADVRLASSYRFIGREQGAMMVATAHNPSGYIVAFDTNIVGEMEKACLLKTSSVPLSSPKDKHIQDSDLLADITARYESIMMRKNYLDPTSDGRAVQHQHKTGLMQPYLTCFAHALVLRQKLTNKCRRYYFVEQDTLLRNAFLNASLDDLLKSEDHLFYYRESDKSMPWFDNERLHIRHLGWWKDKWGIISQSNKTKAACHIKGQNLSKQRWYSLLESNSLEAAEHYLQSACEFFKGLGVSLNEQSLNDWLHIYTGYYNFCWPHRNGKTPAQQLGLMDRAMTIGELLSGYDPQLD